MAWRFDEHGPWVEPVIYQTTAAEDVVSLHYFAEADGDHVKPSLEVNNLVLPGISESPAISPLANQAMGWDLTSWLGRGAPKGIEPGAAVGLARPLLLWFPRPRGQRTARCFRPTILPQAFCCGLADLPNGDFFLTQQHGRGSLAFELRGDLWEHLRGPGQFHFGRDVVLGLWPQLLRSHPPLLSGPRERGDHQEEDEFRPQECRGAGATVVYLG